MKHSLLFLLPVVLCLPMANADVTLPPLFSDNLLLQSAHSAVWGKADPGEKVTVTLGKTTASATADKDGKWRVQLIGLQPGEAGAMTVAGKNQLTVQNVAVGDVWVCSGQSNMEMPLKGHANPSGGVTNFDQEIAAANFPQIRMFTVPKKASDTPLAEVEGKWEVCTPENAPHWSAVGYFFARQLHQDLKLPIGLLSTSWGGTFAQAWTPADVLQGDADFKAAYCDKHKEYVANYPALKEKFDKGPLAAWQVAADAAKAEGKPVPPKPLAPRAPEAGGAPSTLYNAMIAGVTQFPIKGAIWYQGEANVPEASRYRHLLPAMITSWRKAWNQNEFPFYIVQLANIHPAAPQFWPELRDSQRLTAETLPHTGLAVTIDIGEEKCIHPANKQEVGRRLALAAESQTYGKPVVYSGPWFNTAKFDGAQVKISFKPGTAAGLGTANGEPVKGFSLAGADKKFVWADAKIVPAASAQEGTIVLSAPGVQKPVAVRYAWANNPAVNLVNKEGLPAVPFRTDDWTQAESSDAPAAASPKL